ncbi:hypothetical protein ACLB2K_031916 [Fragaria x ananassa]
MSQESETKRKVGVSTEWKLKLNLDEVFKSDGVGGAGVVFRDDKGEVKGCWSKKLLYLQSPLQAKALACRKGLAMAVQLGWKELLVESDSSVLVSALHQSGNSSSGKSLIILLSAYLLSETDPLRSSFLLTIRRLKPATCNPRRLHRKPHRRKKKKKKKKKTPPPTRVKEEEASPEEGRRSVGAEEEEEGSCKKNVSKDDWVRMWQVVQLLHLRISQRFYCHGLSLSEVSP